MGAEQSTPQEPSTDYPLEQIYGFHVLKIKPNSPIAVAGLQSYFDFIVAVNGSDKIETLEEFAGYISQFLNQEVTLTVFSTKHNNVRELTLRPNTNWSSNPKDGMLGCSVRYSSIAKGLENVWHILEVQPRSPAERAGLQPQTDYVVGCDAQTMEQENDFYDLIASHEGKVLSLLVYNTEWDNCREVILIPKAGWGGQGSLGCGVGYGLLHRVPGREAKEEHQPQQAPEKVISPALFSPPAPVPGHQPQDQTPVRTAAPPQPIPAPQPIPTSVTNVEHAPSTQHISHPPPPPTSSDVPLYAPPQAQTTQVEESKAAVSSPPKPVPQEAPVAEQVQPTSTEPETVPSTITQPEPTSQPTTEVAAETAPEPTPTVTAEEPKPAEPADPVEAFLSDLDALNIRTSSELVAEEADNLKAESETTINLDSPAPEAN